MHAKLTYAIKFVGDMDAAIGFYRDTMGLKLRFATPGWSEFDTGDVTLALHAASDDNPAGKVQLGFGTPDLAQLYAGRDASGLTFTAAPEVRFGTLLARMLDGEGVEVSLSGPAA
jgi:catechol 2,3-dioxygenase-like lactoylglutathione lyase family enzyme